MSSPDRRFRPSWGIAAALALLSAALSPSLVGRVISLDWYVGDLRTPLQVLQVALLVTAGCVLVLRRQVDALVSRVFPSGRLLLFKALAVLFSLGLTAGILELGFRVIGYPFDALWTPSEFAIGQFDEELGWDYRPDTRTVQRFGEEQREVVLRFDGHGLRVPDDHVAHDPAAPTVLLVGDSFTMGHGVEFEESFAGRLAADPDFPFQVVNLGVQAYGTDQALLMLRRQAGRFDDVRAVIYTFLADHIVRNANSDRRVLYRHGRFLGTKPRFELTGDGSLRQVGRPRPFEGSGYWRLGAAWRVFFARRGPLPPLDLSRALIGELQRESAKHGATFLVVHWRQARPFTERGIELFAPGLPVPVIDTGAAPPAGWRNWVIPGDGHPTPAAHAYAADLISRRCSALDLGPRTTDGH